MIKTGGARFSKEENYFYFIAGGIGDIDIGGEYHKNLLVAVNEIKNQDDIIKIEKLAKKGKNIFLDSGVYSLAMEHARKHNITSDEAISLAPEDVDGFTDLLERYIYIVSAIESSLWGYIEVDFGGKENKTRTRKNLEIKGLRPVPVYHPLVDGWDYFDYLATNYDRICIGNTVHAEKETRIRLIATIYERQKKYPDLWIHLLGVTPNEWLNAYPLNSGDSSSWLSVARWSGYNEKSDLRNVGTLPINYRYVLGDAQNDEKGRAKSMKMAAYGAYFMQRNWHNHIEDIEQL